MSVSWVLSAAHCFVDGKKDKKEKNEEKIRKYNVSAGRVRNFAGRSDPERGQFSRIDPDNVFIHPFWGGMDTMVYDVALVKVRPTLLGGCSLSLPS